MISNSKSGIIRYFLRGYTWEQRKKSSKMDIYCSMFVVRSLEDWGLSGEYKRLLYFGLIEFLGFSFKEWMMWVLWDCRFMYYIVHIYILLFFKMRESACVWKTYIYIYIRFLGVLVACLTLIIRPLFRSLGCNVHCFDFIYDL